MVWTKKSLTRLQPYILCENLEQRHIVFRILKGMGFDNVTVSPDDELIISIWDNAGFITLSTVGVNNYRKIKAGAFINHMEKLAKCP